MSQLISLIGRLVVTVGPPKNRARSERRRRSNPRSASVASWIMWRLNQSAGRNSLGALRKRACKSSGPFSGHHFTTGPLTLVAFFPSLKTDSFQGSRKRNGSGVQASGCRPREERPPGALIGRCPPILFPRLIEMSSEAAPLGQHGLQKSVQPFGASLRFLQLLEKWARIHVS